MVPGTIFPVPRFRSRASQGACLEVARLIGRGWRLLLLSELEQFVAQVFLRHVVGLQQLADSGE